MRSSSDLTTRARIRDAALARFGAEGVGRVSLRAIAADVGVSSGLVVHHFGSKEGLRRACDAYVVAQIRGDDRDNRGGGDAPDAVLRDLSGLAKLLESSALVRRYMARALLDGSPAAATLFDDIVEVTAAWLAGGERAGWVRPTDNPRERAALYVAWVLSPLMLGEHLSRAFGADLGDLDVDAVLRYWGVAGEMLTHGVFTDTRWMGTWREVMRQRQGESR